MSDENALLAAIWEHPHEDTPRLMYADWLDEHEQASPGPAGRAGSSLGAGSGSARAEFIRAQCERARLDEWDDADRIDALTKREAVLWKPNVKAWKAPLPKALQNAPFRRGFVYPRPLGLGGAKFVKLKPDALDAAPQWTATLRNFNRQFDNVFTSPLLLRVNELAIESGTYPGDVLEKLADNDRLRNVTDLFVSCWKKTPASVAAFYSGSATVSVTRLFAGTLAAPTFAALAASPVAARLRHLAFWIDGTDMAAWAGCDLGASRFPRLRSLQFNYSTSTGHAGASLARLLTAAPTAPLRKVVMNWCRVTDDEMEQLSAWPGLAEVRHLELDSNVYGEAGYRALVRSPHAGNLTYLKVDGWNLRNHPDANAELDARFGAAIHYK